MNTLTKTFFVALIATLPAASSLAQNSAAAKPKSNFRPAPLTPSQMLFDEIIFDDIAIREVVEFLRQEKVTSGLNFIVSKDIAEVSITLQLRRVSFEQLIKAIEIGSGGSVKIEAVSGAGNLYHVQPGPQQQPVPDPVLAVFNLSKFLTGKQTDAAQQAIEELHQTVELAFDMLANAQRAAGKRAAGRSKVDTKFHPGTKLMLVIGDPSDVEVFREVITQLTGQNQHSRRPGSFGFGGISGMGGSAGSFGGGDEEFGMEDAGDGGGLLERSKKRIQNRPATGGFGGLGGGSIRR